jgi:hypothetical protein
MKYLLFTLLLLAGCGAQTWQAPTAIENPQHRTMFVARGTNGVNSWSCTDEEVNDKLVWVRCGFINQWPAIAGKSTANSCVRVGFYTEEGGLPIAQSRQVCSGPLQAGGTSINYAAFTGKERSALKRCGSSLNYCVMLVEPETLQTMYCPPDKAGCEDSRP